MNVYRSSGQPDLIYVLLTDRELEELRKALKGVDSPLAKPLREKLKAVRK